MEERDPRILLNLQVHPYTAFVLYRAAKMQGQQLSDLLNDFLSDLAVDFAPWVFHELAKRDYHFLKHAIEDQKHAIEDQKTKDQILEGVESGEEEIIFEIPEITDVGAMDEYFKQIYGEVSEESEIGIDDLVLDFERLMEQAGEYKKKKEEDDEEDIS